MIPIIDCLMQQWVNVSKIIIKMNSNLIKFNAQITRSNLLLLYQKIRQFLLYDHLFEQQDYIHSISYIQFPFFKWLLINTHKCFQFHALSTLINIKFMERAKIRSILNYMRHKKCTEKQNEQIDYSKFNDMIFGVHKKELNIEGINLNDSLQNTHTSFTLSTLQTNSQRHFQDHHTPRQARTSELKKQSRMNKLKLPLKISSLPKDRLITQNLQQLGINKKKINQRSSSANQNISTFDQDLLFKSRLNIQGKKQAVKKNYRIMSHGKNIVIKDLWMQEKIPKQAKTLSSRQKIQRRRLVCRISNSQRIQSSRERKNSDIAPWDIRQSSYGLQ